MIWFDVTCMKMQLLVSCLNRVFSKITSAKTRFLLRVREREEKENLHFNFFFGAKTWLTFISEPPGGLK